MVGKAPRSLNFAEIGNFHLKIQKLEQLRILGKIDIKVGYCDSNALSVDTFQDLQRAESEMR